MNIPEMIEALIGLGMTQGQIGALAGASQPTVHRALHGSSVTYVFGKAIERLYDEAVIQGRPLEELSRDVSPEVA